MKTTFLCLCLSFLSIAQAQSIPKKLLTSSANVSEISRTTITNLEQEIYSTPVNNAECYTFYVTNLITAQTYQSPCTVNHSIKLSSVGIPLNPGDQIDLSVSYTVNGTKSVVSGVGNYTLNQPRKFCEILQSNSSPDPKKQSIPSTKMVSYNVGTKFILTYDDHNADPYYAAAPWDNNTLPVIETAKRVLEDMDAFLNRNFVDASCGYSNQRMTVYLSPYIQLWVNTNAYANALGVAEQTVLPNDVNYLSQGCSETPIVQLMTINFPYGDFMSMGIGHIYLNPAVTNFSMTYPSAPSGGEYDLYSVILHELTHILGINYEDFKFKDLLYAGSTPLNAPGIFDCAEDPNYPALSTSTCTSVSCIGNYTNDPIYAPSPWEDGSSLSHFPDNCAGTPLGNNVMNPGISMGQTKRVFHQREINALQDLGYNFTNPFNAQTPETYTLNNTPYIVGNHDGLLVQEYPDEGFLCNGVTYQPINHQLCDTWPLNLTPLTNDINATFIQEAVVKTGNTNATVTITGANNDQLNFTATMPGVYTIAYLPANPDRTGLPTYIQVYVPPCDDNLLDDLTCNDAPNCNQICFFSNVYEHTLLAGNMFTFPALYTDNSFDFACNSQETSQGSSIYEPSYSSVFFWVNTNPATEYAISLKRSYTELGYIGMANPHVKSYAYLVKSSDMINGQFNQSSNNFASLPANKQLIYEELFTADNYPLTTVSLCFTANDDYDMLLFYDEQINNFSQHRSGKVYVKNLEFMEKEPISLPTEIAACLPHAFSLGEEFCAPSTASISWTSQNNTILTTDPFYAQDNVTSPIDDEYTFTVTYPSLPATFITPSSNASCNFSQSIPINIVECCQGATTPLLHPLTSVSSGRTFGMDVDGDNNGAIYYSGDMDPNVTFGNQTVSCVVNGAIEGFLLKMDDYCVNWLIRTPFSNSKLEVTNDGRIFYLGGSWGSSKYKWLANYSNSNGAIVWSWNVNPAQVELTDFTLDETNNNILVTGRMLGSNFNYNGTTVTGTPDDIFVMKLSYNGVYMSHVVIPIVGSFSESRVTARNNHIFVAYAQATGQWRLAKLNTTTLAVLASPVPATIATVGQSTFAFKGLEVDANNVLGQLVYTNTVTYNGSNILIGGSGTKTGYFKVSANTLTAPTASLLSLVDYAITLPTNDVDMDVLNGKAIFSYRNSLHEVHVKSINVSTGATIWDKMTVGLTSGDWVANTAAKITPSDVYNTGSFYHDAFIDNSDIITANPAHATFYGIRYQESNGTILAIEANESASEFENTDNQILDLNTNNLSSITVFPNPGNGLYTIKAAGNYQVTIRDIQGKIIGQLEGNGQSNFDITNQSKGIYMIEILCENETQVFKLIKE